MQEQGRRKPPRYPTPALKPGFPRNWMNKKAFATISVFTLLLNGCAAALPSPQISPHKADHSISSVVANARTKHFCSSKKCAVQRFFSNGPGTVVVAQHLHLGAWSANAPHSAASFAGSTAMFGSTLVGGATPLGLGLFLLGASSKGSLPNWAAYYHYTTKAMRAGTVMQVVRVYPMGSDPLQASKKEAIALGQQSLRYLATLTLPDGRKLSVQGSRYQKTSQGYQYVYYVGTSEADHQGNVSVDWWEENTPTAFGAVVMGSDTLSSQVGLPGNLLHTANALVNPNEYALSEIQCMPVPGDPGEGLAVSTFLFRKPSLFIGAPAYTDAVKIFANDYLVASSYNGPGGVFLWHQQKSQAISVPSLK